MTLGLQKPFCVGETLGRILGKWGHFAESAVAPARAQTDEQAVTLGPTALRVPGWPLEHLAKDMFYASNDTIGDAPLAFDVNEREAASFRFMDRTFRRRP